MNAELLSSILAIFLSLAASYLPGFNDWYDPLPPNLKRLVMLALLAVTSAGCYAIACVGYAQALDLPVACDQPGAIEMLRAFIAAVIANQAAYAVSPSRDS